ncbi:MAG: PAS domain S-box protein [Chloroflexota bacterium]
MNKPVSILYVDDNPLDRELVRDALEREHGGFELIEAASATEFETSLAQGGFDLVLSDFNILGFEGLQVLEAVHKSDPHLPVIIVTGTGSEEVAAQAIKDGAADYVIKTPKHIQHLPHTIHVVLETKRLEDERQQAEEALQKSQEGYRRLHESMRDCFVQVKMKGEIIDVNPAFQEMLGYSKEDLLRLSNVDITPQQWHKLEQEIIDTQVLPVGYSDVYEKEYIKKDGSVFPIEIRTFLLRDDNGLPSGMWAIVRDITERKRVEQNLRESQQYNRMLFETSPTGLYLCRMDGFFVDCNEAYAKIIGYSIAETITLSFWDITPEKYTALEHVQLDSLNATGRYGPYEKEYIHKDGHLVPVQLTGLIIEKGGEKFIWSSAEDITERKQSEEKILVHLRRLNALHKVDLTIAGMIDIRVTLDTFLQETVSQLKVDAARIFLLSSDAHTLTCAASTGFLGRGMFQPDSALGEDFAGRIALERQPIQISDLSKTVPALARDHLFIREGFGFYMGLPLIAKGKVRGVFEIFNRSLLEPDADWQDFLQTLAGQATIAIDNNQLFDSLQRASMDLSIAYDDTIVGWSKALDLRDRETEGHSQRVAKMTFRMANAMRFNDADLVQLRRGALLHDIGKMGIPDSILAKPGPLSDEEWLIMRKHPVFAYEMLSPINYLRPAVEIPYCHHEKWDGTGYPRGLKGEQIPLSARLFAVVDVWDALRSDRPYRQRWPEDKVFEYIRKESGSHFDPKAVEIFFRVMSEKEYMPD